MPLLATIVADHIGTPLLLLLLGRLLLAVLQRGDLRLELGVGGIEL